MWRERGTIAWGARAGPRSPGPGLFHLTIFWTCILLDSWDRKGIISSVEYQQNSGDEQWTCLVPRPLQFGILGLSSYH